MPAPLLGQLHSQAAHAPTAAVHQHAAARRHRNALQALQTWLAVKTSTGCRRLHHMLPCLAQVAWGVMARRHG